MSEPPSPLTDRVEAALRRAGSYVRGQRLPCGSYSLQDQCEPTLLATCFGALVHVLLSGEPDAGALRLILAHRDADDRFTDPRLQLEEIDSTLHPHVYLTDQTHYFAVRALRACGTDLPNPAPPVEMPAVDPRGWLESLDWSDPWLEGNRVMFALELLLPGNPAAHARLLDWLSANVDPLTGFWGTDRGATLLRGMAGAYHFYGFLIGHGRPLPDPETVVGSTLALQHADGLFAPAGGGNSCLDMDGIDILCLFELALTAEGREAARDALLRAADATLALQHPDGGFPESNCVDARRRQAALRAADPERLSQTWCGERRIRYSSWARMEYDATRSDLWSTLCRVLSLLRAVQVFGNGATCYSLPPIAGPGIGQLLRWEGCRCHRT